MKGSPKSAGLRHARATICCLWARVMVLGVPLRGASLRAESSSLSSSPSLTPSPCGPCSKAARRAWWSPQRLRQALTVSKDRPSSRLVWPLLCPLLARSRMAIRCPYWRRVVRLRLSVSSSRYCRSLMGMAGAGGLPLFIKLSLCLGDEGKKTADYFIPEALVFEKRLLKKNDF